SPSPNSFSAHNSTLSTCSIEQYSPSSVMSDICARNSLLIVHPPSLLGCLGYRLASSSALRSLSRSTSACTHCLCQSSAIVINCLFSSLKRPTSSKSRNTSGSSNSPPT